MASRRSTAIWILFVLLAAAPPLVARDASAQLSDQISDRRLRRSNALNLPWSYKNAKDERARNEGSSWATFGGIGSGIDSNIFESQRNEKSSAMFDGILQLEHLRYPTEVDRLRFTALTTSRVHTASSKPDEYIARAYAGWRHEHSERFKFELEGGFKYENDDVVQTEGSDAKQVPDVKAGSS